LKKETQTMSAGKINSGFLYKTAIMRDVSNSLAEEGLRMEESAVNISKAISQQHYYKQVLKSLGVNVLSIAADETLPDCVFVEDPVIVVGNRALLTKLGHENRRKEKVEMKKCVEKIKGLKIFEMSEMDEKATLDGGDVLYTGKELFVGMSTRTNAEGVAVLRRCFGDEVKVHEIPVRDGLHLKSCMTMCGVDTVMCSVENQGTRDMLEDVKKKATVTYKFIEAEITPVKANVIYIEIENRGSICLHSVMTSKAEQKALNAIEVDEKIEVDLSELNKVDGCLTCCTVFMTV